MRIRVVFPLSEPVSLTPWFSWVLSEGAATLNRFNGEARAPPCPDSDSFAVNLWSIWSIDNIKQPATSQEIHNLASLVWRAKHHYSPQIIHRMTTQKIPNKYSSHRMSDKMNPGRSVFSALGYSLTDGNLTQSGDARRSRWVIDIRDSVPGFSECIFHDTHRTLRTTEPVEENHMFPCDGWFWIHRRENHENEDAFDHCSCHVNDPS